MPKPPMMKVDVQFKCPFCDLDAGASTKSEVVVHAIPYCEQFIDLPAERFLKAARLKHVGPQPYDKKENS